jgi:(heptosyl)LPS beta-1,4-glucosyltransferase
MRRTISCVMIVLNEEQNIRNALESVQWMDEVIVVDAYSHDRTVAICQEYPSKVLLRKWTGAPDQRNYAIQHATCDWVFNLDADERVLPKLREELEAVLVSPNPQAYAGYFIPRKNFYYGKWVQGGGWYPDYQLRFFKRGVGAYGEVEVHPRFNMTGSIGYFRHPMEHLTFPTIAKHFQKQNAFTSRAAKERQKTKSTVFAIDLWGRPIFTFLKYFLVRKGFQDGIHGLIASGFSSMYTFGKYAKLFELQRASRKV